MCVSINQSINHPHTTVLFTGKRTTHWYMTDWLALTHSLLSQQQSFLLDFKCSLACKVHMYTLDFTLLHCRLFLLCVLYLYITTSHDGRKQWFVFIQLKMLIYILSLQFNRRRRFFFIIIYLLLLLLRYNFLTRTHSCSYRSRSWQAAGIPIIIQSSKHGGT